MDKTQGSKGSSPMKYRLEPLGYGEILDRMFLIYKDNLGLFLLLVVICFSPYLLSQIIGMAFMHSGDQAMMTGMGCLNMIIFIPHIIGSLIYLGATIKVVVEAYKGRRIDLKSALQYGWKKMGPMFVTGLLYGLAVFGITILLLLGLMIIHGATAWKSTVLLVVGILVMPVILFFLLKFAFTYAMCFYLVVLEDRWSMDALKRSKELFYATPDAKFKIVLIPILINVMLIGAISAVTILSGGSLYVQMVVNILVQFLNPLYMIAMTVIYYDIRVRAEGYGMEAAVDRLMESGRTVEPPYSGAPYHPPVSPGPDIYRPESNQEEDN